MTKWLQYAEQLLREKEMNDQYIAQTVNKKELPIITHHVVLYYSANVKYDVLQLQLVKFIANDKEGVVTQGELIELLGVTDAQFTELLAVLNEDAIIDFIEDSIRLTEKGKEALQTGYSPTRELQKNITFYYEPITSYLVKDLNDFPLSSGNEHLACTSDSYKMDYCHYLDEGLVIELYEEVTGEKFSKLLRNIQFDRISHQVNKSGRVITIQDLHLFNRLENGIVQSIWNPKNNKLVRLA